MQADVKMADLVGKTVITNEGNLIGKIHEFIVNVDSWEVTNFQVEVEKKTAKELGIKTKLFGNVLVLIETARISAVADQVVIDLPADKLSEYSKELTDRYNESE